MRTLRLFLGDQLNLSHSWLNQVNDDHIYLMAEMRQETDYVKHHIQKVTVFFCSMRYFANTLKERGHQVVYLKIGNTANPQNLPDLIDQIISEKKIEKFEYQLPDEYRLYRQLQAISKSISIPSETFDTEHFYTSRDELENHFKGKKQLLMESFYRMMRKKHNILMEKTPAPFNSLYWNFLEEKKSHFKDNQRMSMMLRLLEKKSKEELTELKERAEKII